MSQLITRGKHSASHILSFWSHGAVAFSAARSSGTPGSFPIIYGILCQIFQLWPNVPSSLAIGQKCSEIQVFSASITEASFFVASPSDHFFHWVRPIEGPTGATVAAWEHGGAWECAGRGTAPQRVCPPPESPKWSFAFSSLIQALLTASGRDSTFSHTISSRFAPLFLFLAVLFQSNKQGQWSDLYDTRCYTRAKGKQPDQLGVATTLSSRTLTLRTPSCLLSYIHGNQEKPISGKT